MSAGYRYGQDAHKVEVLILAGELSLEVVERLVPGVGGEVLVSELGLDSAEHVWRRGCLG